jgi:hypothetical protein
MVFISNISNPKTKSPKFLVLGGCGVMGSPVATISNLEEYAHACWTDPPTLPIAF